MRLNSFSDLSDLLFIDNDNLADVLASTEAAIVARESQATAEAVREVAA